MSKVYVQGAENVFSKVQGDNICKSKWSDVHGTKNVFFKSTGVRGNILENKVHGVKLK